MPSLGRGRIDRGWRIAATGLSFALFGLGGPIVAALISLIYLFYALIPQDKHKKYELARFILRYTFKLYIGFMKLVGLLTYEIIEPERFQTPGNLVIANHPSLLDVVFLFSIIRNANCIVKESLFHNLFTLPPIRAAGYISNSDAQFLDKSAESLQACSSIIIFPEGTRTRAGEPLKFLRGAANIAVHAKCDITPILIECRPATLLKNQKWYDIPAQPPHFVFHALPPISIKPFLNDDLMPSAQARKLTQYLEDFYRNLLSH
ncbi:lysophospholipid acyltransferase family protein [Marinibactrum halimedae]|nr:lysophospholipid acyltransferase family protein [Marinibactrum halimedae]MCD9460434.1 1-acyl-sn-glycerol-3-phosphate acyltransferase [Marinibactrum halimedae]